MVIGFSHIGIQLQALGLKLLHENYSATVEIPKELEGQIIDSLEKGGFIVQRENEQIFSIKYKNELK